VLGWMFGEKDWNFDDLDHVLGTSLYLEQC
jgi:hypothetical protein